MNQMGKPNSTPKSDKFFRGNLRVRMGDIITNAALNDETAGWKVKDRVVVRVQITVYGEFTHTVATPDPVPAPIRPPSTLETDIADLLSNGGFYESKTSSLQYLNKHVIHSRQGIPLPICSSFI